MNFRFATALSALACGALGAFVLTTPVAGSVPPDSTSASILVGFESGTTDAEIQAIETRHELVLERAFQSIRARQYRLAGDADVAAVLKAIAAESGVEYAERDQTVRALPTPKERS